MRRLSRKGFLWSGAALLGGYGSIKYLATRSQDMGTPWPFRRVLDINGDLWTDAFSQSPVPRHATITKLRQNGSEGLGEWDPATWKLSVEGIAGEEGAKEFTLGQIKALPRHEMTTELCCIEGWSMVVRWAGGRFVDFMKAYPPITQDGEDPNFAKPENLAKYVALETPDGRYYVGLDMPSAIHPDTLLCYEMNGKPLDELEEDHGAPLRLVIPVKYGIKNLKRIGTIRYTNDKPKDFWAEQGYDWHAGL
jgi:DMSO/TMAO reductase YedYZ molybdopterin-dependent catalytic subunit